MADKPLPRDPQVEAANEIYKTARVSAEIEIARRDKIIAELKEEKEGLITQAKAMGVLEKIRLDRAHNDLIEAMTFYKIKQMKLYKEGGFTWEKFCEAVKINWRTADRIIEDIKPLYELYSVTVTDFSGIPMSKIRYLGKALPGISDTVTENGNRVFTVDGSKVVIDFNDPQDIEAAIDRLMETNKKQSEDLAAQKRAHERVQEETHKALTKAEKEIARLEKSIVVSDLPPEVQALIDLMSKVQTDLITGVQAINKAIADAGNPLAAQRAYYFLCIFLQKIGWEEREILHEKYAGAEETPWEITEEDLPSTEVLIHESPATRGLKVKLKSDGRKA